MTVEMCAVFEESDQCPLGAQLQYGVIYRSVNSEFAMSQYDITAK